MPDLFTSLSGAADAIGQATGILPQSTTAQPNNQTGSASNTASPSGTSITGGAAPATASIAGIPSWIWIAGAGGLLLLVVVLVATKK